jgi:hypothetical protein
MKTKCTLRAMAAIVASLMIFFTAALPVNAVADEPPVKKFHADVIYAYSQWGDSREIYSYDCGTLITILEQESIDEDWMDSKLETYTYDADGLLSHKVIDYISWGGYLERYTYTYDVNGNKLTEVAEYDDGGVWFPMEKNTYTYDANANMLTMLYQYWTGMDWENGELWTYTYDSFGNCLSTFIQVWMGSWKDNFRGLSTYENGVLISHTNQQYMPPGFWMTTVVTYFYYNEDGNYLNIINKIFGNNWSKIEYTFEPGHIVGQTYSWTSGAWVIGGNTAIRMELMADGVKTVFPTQSGSMAEVYYSQELYVEPSPYQAVYLGYPPAECVEVSAAVSGGTAPYTYLWDNGETGESFLACPEESTAYTVLVTDAEGCTFEASTRVCVIDVRCGKNLDKVALCHCPPGNPNNCKTLCVSVADVAEHLAHGDLLGPCGTDHSCTDFKTALAAVICAEYDEDIFLQAYPNPFEKSTTISYRVSVPGNVTIRLVNATGQQVRRLYEGYSADGELQHLQINMEHLQPGMYICILQQADGSMVTHKIVVRR